MSDQPRFAFDINVIVSALLFEHSVPARAFFEGLRRGKLLISHEVASELAEVLRRPKFDRYVLREVRETFLKRFIQSATLVDVVESVRECRDPNDDKFLELAINGNAECIVTGDADLLILNPFREISILTPSDFLAALNKVD